MNDELEIQVQKRTADLLRASEGLREELRLAREQIAELGRRLEDAKLGSQAERETRRAALNLMEDALQARRAEQHELEERRRIEEALRESDRRKDEFLAMLAHELRNPLAPLLNSLQLLRLGEELSPAVEHVRDIMERQVHHLVRLVDDLLDISRITRGKIELKKEMVELDSIIATAVETSRPLINAGGHQLALALPKSV